MPDVDPREPLDVAAVAAALLRAYEDRVPLPPLTESHPGLGLDEAYAVQLAQVRTRSATTPVVGYKVGLTSRAIQEQLGVDQPDFGHLFSDMPHPAEAPIRTSAYIAPRVEPEIAFVLGSPLRGPGVTAADVLAATAFVLPALEVIDSRIADWRIRLADTVADNASSGGFVLGTTATSLAGLDTSLVGALMRVDGRIATTGVGAAVLGSPVTAVAWLANTLGARGTGLGAGHVVLSGSLTAAVPVTAGSAVTAVFDRLGSVTAVFD